VIWEAMECRRHDVSVFPEKFPSRTSDARVITSGEIRCTSHVARMGKLRGAYNVLVIKYEENITWETWA
jgi:hypothetical protein